MNVTGSEPAYQHREFQLFHVADDPSERADLINDTAHAAVVAQLKEFYQSERNVSVFPFSLGKRGKPNKDGVWEPWL